MKKYQSFLFLIIFLWSVPSFATMKHSSEKSKIQQEPIHSGFFIEGDFLYWIPEVDGLEYAVTNLTVNPNLVNIHDVTYKWKPGYRVGVGWRFKNAWDLGLTYTYFKSNGSSNQGSPSSGSLADFFPSFFGSISQIAARSARSSINLHYHVGDFDFVSHAFSSHRLELLFWLGFKGAYIKQDWNTSFERSPLDPTQGLDRVEIHWDLWGVGGRFGMAADLELGKGFALFANMSLNALLGRQKYTYFQSGVDNQVSTTTIGSNVNVNFRDTKIFPVVESAIGIAWGGYFSDAWGVTLSAAYELINWWDINVLKTLQTNIGFDQRGAGNIGFHGGTLRLTVDF